MKVDPTDTTTPPAVCRSGYWTYLTETAARDARQRARAHGRIYPCTLCHHWHWRRNDRPR